MPDACAVECKEPGQRWLQGQVGPSLNILIKLMAMVAIVFAGLTVRYAPVIAQWLGM